MNRVLLPTFLALFAASLHFLVTVEAVGSPLRIGASDILLPVLGLLLGLLWWRQHPGPVRYPPRLGFWLAAMLGWIGFSTLRVWGASDSASSWALLKLVGFIILVGYFAVGGLAGALLRPQAVRWAYRAYVLTAWGVAAYALARYVLAAYGFHPSPWYPRMPGFAENPNTYGLLAASAWITQLAWRRDGPILGHRWDRVGEVLLLATVLLSASRSAYLGLVLAVAILAWRRWLPLSAVFRPAAVTALLLVTLLSVVPRLLEGVIPGEDAYGFYLVERDYVGLGVSSRMQLARDAFEMWLHNPLLGGGVGSFMRAQMLAYPGAAVTTNHNTLLWWLSEMGLVGAVIFGGFVLMVARRLFKCAEIEPCAMTALGILLLLIGASLGTEVMYQRYAWFFLGLALVNGMPADGDGCHDRRAERGGS